MNYALCIVFLLISPLTVSAQECPLGQRAMTIAGSSGCQTIDSGVKEGIWLKKYPDNVVYEEQHFLHSSLHGTVTYFYRSGEIKGTAEYQNGVKEGKTLSY